MGAKQQRHVIYTIMKNEKNLSCQVGHKKYIVNGCWWRRWCDYVNLNENIDDLKLLT